MESEVCMVFFLFVIICLLLQSFSQSKEFRNGLHVSTWLKLLRTLILQCLCHNDSIPSRTFLCFNPLSLSLTTISVFPQSTQLWHSMVCRARTPSSLPICFSANNVFPVWRSSFVNLTLSMCSFFLVWKRCRVSTTYCVLAGTTNHIYNVFLPFAQQLLTCLSG